MVNKEEYYRRKAAGLCTKCGKSREGSPSQARCLECHSKLKNKQTKSEETVQPESTIEDTDSSKIDLESLKRQTLLSKTVDAKVCGICGENIGSFNLFCQKCLKVTHFSKTDAILRYGSQCSSCNSTEIKQLRIVSSDIGIPMKEKDSELYKVICYRRIKPAEYKVQCYSCYWRDSIQHVRQLKQLFNQTGYFHDNFEEDEDDIIDI